MSSSPLLADLRNIGIIAHIDAGKTTLTERILFYARRIHRMGEVHEGAATMDFMPEEQERGITIASAATTCEWAGKTVTIIDTPGHVDFSIEVERSLRVLDGAVGVFCAVGGVEPQSETVWRQAEKFKIPRLAFVNKMDRPGASYARVIDEIKEVLGARAVPAVIPVGEGEDFEAVIDLVTMERLDFDQSDKGREYTRRPLDDAEAALAAPWRDRLLEALADEDELIMERYLSGESVEAAHIRTVMRSAVIAGGLVPVFAGSALKNAGVQPLLDGVVDYLPNPAEVAPPEAVLPDGGGKQVVRPEADAPLAALVFKLYMEGGRKLSLLRVYAGTVSEGMDCYNVTRKQAERITRIYRLHADEREQVGRAGPGEIVAVQGLRSVYTGDSIALKSSPLLLEDIFAHMPVISIALEPKNSEEGDKLDEVLSRFALEDPTLKIDSDEASGQRVVFGMGELHLEVLRDRMNREYGLAPRAGNPQVICQETITRSAESSGEFDRELGEVPHYGYVELRVSPRERGKGNLVRWAFDTEGWPKAWTDSAAQGAEDSLQSGITQGYPVEDVLVEITGLKRRDNSSSPAGYHMAAVSAVKSALNSAGPVILEPIMYVEINTPEAFLGAALSLVSTHGGKVENMLERGGQKIIKALAPMRELFGFSTFLRSATQGRAGLLMRFERFDSI